MYENEDHQHPQKNQCFDNNSGPIPFHLTEAMKLSCFTATGKVIFIQYEVPNVHVGVGVIVSRIRHL